MKTIQRSRFMVLLAFGGLFGAAAVPSVFGCGLHPAMDIELDSMYPAPLSVASHRFLHARNFK